MVTTNMMPRKNHLVRFDDEIDVEQLKYCFNQEEIPFGSSVQIIIAADLERQPHKYANRGYRLTLIEAGHVAENISLYCTEQGLGACEMGGVQDEPMKRELKMPDNVWPLLAVAIGHSAGPETEWFNKLNFVEEHVGVCRPVRKVFSRTFGNDGAFFGATATYLDAKGNIQYAGATSASDADAVFKATIEGYERWWSSQARVDFHGSAKQVPGQWLDPREYFPLTKAQIKKCGVRRFTEDLDIDWVLGNNYDGNKIYVPCDCAYYGHRNDKDRIYYGNSSGVAAHFNAEEAKKRAIVELIERDALMRSWYIGIGSEPFVIREDYLPIHVKKRIKYWREQNREMMVIQFDSEYGLVFGTFIVSDEFPCFVSGAAATLDSAAAVDTIHKSLQEAEYNLLLALRYTDRTPINRSEVSTPADHGRYYYSAKNAHYLCWLWELSPTTPHVRPNIEFENLEDLYEQLRITTVNLSDAESDIKVVRAFSPELVPINFGVNSAHYTHQQLKKYHVSDLSPAVYAPHYFA